MVDGWAVKTDAQMAASTADSWADYLDKRAVAVRVDCSAAYLVWLLAVL